MASRAHLYAGAAQGMGGLGRGLFRLALGDGAWQRLAGGLPEEADVHAVTVHPDDSATIYAGTTRGLYRSGNRGHSWERLDLPGVPDIWSVTVDRNDPRRLYAGATPVALYRSEDGGAHWQRLPDPPLPHDRVVMDFACRVMRIAVDPGEPQSLYATLEANGTIRSRNGGESWEDCSAGLIRFCEEPRYRSRIGSQTELEGMLDGHALAVSAAAPRTVFLANRMGLFKSENRGEEWADIEIGRFSPLTYGRDIRVSPQDPRVLYAALSPAARSEDGSIYRSEDLGKSWKRFDRGVKAEATMMAVALDPRDPKAVFGVSRVGQVFATLDGGESWRESRLPADCRDVYALACG
jgi:photosystem II stability/assembly factor-like uncharacterized protein